MKFGHALERILWEILLANPEHTPVKVNKTDLRDGFYCEDLNPLDVPKLGVIFPTKPGSQHLVAIPLVLPMSPGFLHGHREDCMQILQMHVCKMPIMSPSAILWKTLRPNRTCPRWRS